MVHTDRLGPGQPRLDQQGQAHPNATFDVRAGLELTRQAGGQGDERASNSNAHTHFHSETGRQGTLVAGGFYLACPPKPSTDKWQCTPNVPGTVESAPCNHVCGGVRFIFAPYL